MDNAHDDGHAAHGKELDGDAADIAVDAAAARWIVDEVRAGAQPDDVIDAMCARGWQRDAAMDAVEETVRAYLAEHARENGLPAPRRVPAPTAPNGPSLLSTPDREVQVLAQMRHPHVVVFGGLLSHAECDALVAMGQARITRSPTFNPDTGADEPHEARTSEGMFFRRGENALCAVIEARIAALLDWPLDHGEGLQLLRYGVGAEYRPHHDYFDPARRGAHVALSRGGQRVASLVMYLNTPESGGATTFPDVQFEVAAVKGNAVFFSYDRPHEMTRTLHGGAPVLAGEKWVATKWLREAPHI